MENFDAMDLLASGTVVYVGDISRYLITWNESAVFNVWHETDDGKFAPVTAFTNFGITNTEHAKQVAREWILDYTDNL